MKGNKIMTVKRCKHGMIIDQCGVCKKWEEHCWSKTEEAKSDQYSLGKNISKKRK